MYQTQNQDRILDELTEFLREDSRISYVFCSENYLEGGPTLGSAVDLLFDYFILGGSSALRRLHTQVSTECDAFEEQSIREAIASFVDRLRQIPESPFSFIFQIRGSTTVEFQFHGSDRQSAVRFLYDFLNLEIREVWGQEIRMAIEPTE